MGERLHDALDAFHDVFGASTRDPDDLVDLGGSSTGSARLKRGNPETCSF